VSEPSLDEQVESLFRIGGPYGDEETRAAARTIAALVRYLNHATWHDDATPYPSTIDSAVHALAGAVAGLDQLLRQLDNRMTALARRPDAYATGSDPVRHVAAEFAAILDDARSDFYRAHAALSAAGEFSSRLGLREPDDTGH
jgi:hypothetical protein